MSNKLALVMMVKNEAPRIVQTTLNSIKGYVKTAVIYDTGSTDGTPDVFRKFCAENGIKLHLKEGLFVNFCVSRNVLLDFCDEVLEPNTYLLQMDAHDELQGGNKLIELIDSFKMTHTGFYITQRWFSGANIDSYCNVRLVRSHNGWRYRGVVHEYIMCDDIANKVKPDHEVIFRTDGIYLYQDRTADNDSSFRRFSRDKELLYAEYVKDPHEPRTLFYLAQTCSCLGQIDESYRYYMLRIKEIGFYEEVYQSFVRLGDLAKALHHDWEESMTWYLKAYQHSQRAEPLVKIAEYYREYNLCGEKKPEWHTCYTFANMACQLIFPCNQILFVDRLCYTYKRWHLLGISAFYVGRYKEGKEACLKALESENKDIDRHNLKFYLDKEINVMLGERLACPALFAATLQEAEVRHVDEFDVKFDRKSIISETLDKIASERKTNGGTMPGQVINTIKEGQTVLKNQQAEPPPNSKPKKQTRREKLRMLVSKR